MRIASINVYHVAMPLLYPWRTAYGEDAAIDSVLVRIESDGVCGWGEATPFARPEYSAEWAHGAFSLVRDCLGPSVVAADIETVAELQPRLAQFKGNYFAKAALDIALWNLESKKRNTPLHKLLGGTRSVVPIGADFGVMDSIDDLLFAVNDAVESGFSRVKLKFCRGWELAVVSEVRSTFPKLKMHVDCNSSYTLDDVGLFQALDSLGLEMIEQPLAHDDLVEHAKLQRMLQTPVCLDESIVSARQLKDAIELGSCQYLNIKPGRVGGLTCAVELHDLCKAAEIPCWVGGNLESGVGAAVAVALGTLENFVYPADIFPNGRFYQDDLASPLVRFGKDAEGQPVAIPSETYEDPPEPDRDRLSQAVVEAALVDSGPEREKGEGWRERM
jgi:O-succinylbenzoate synthase